MTYCITWSEKWERGGYKKLSKIYTRKCSIHSIIYPQCPINGMHTLSGFERIRNSKGPECVCVCGFDSVSACSISFFLFFFGSLHTKSLTLFLSLSLVNPLRVSEYCKRRKLQAKNSSLNAWLCVKIPGLE